MSSINISGYNTQFQNFVNFANERVKAGKDDAIALVEEGSTSLGVRSIKAASSDRAGHFAASFFRTNASKSANDVARDIFKRAISDCSCPLLKDILLSEYIPLTEVFDDNENSISQTQAKVFPAVQVGSIGPGRTAWGCGSRQAIGD